MSNRHPALNFEKAEAIRARLAEGVSQCQLAREYGVTQHAIFQIAHGKTYKPGAAPRRFLTHAQADDIRARCAAGEKQRALAAEYRVHKSAVAHIIAGRNHSARA